MSAQHTPGPDVFREYFEAHRAFLFARQKSEAASHAHIVGYMNPSYSQGEERYAATVQKNERLDKAANEARDAYLAATDRFNSAMSAAIAKAGGASC